MQGPDSRLHEITDAAVGARAWRDEAKRYQQIADEAREAAARTWERGDVRACEIALRTAESALRWCEACAAKADAWSVMAWAACEEDPMAGLADYLDAGDAATDAEAVVTLCREAVAGCLRVRRVAVVVPACSGETLCAEALE